MANDLTIKTLQPNHAQHLIGKQARQDVIRGLQIRDDEMIYTYIWVLYRGGPDPGISSPQL